MDEITSTEIETNKECETFGRQVAVATTFCTVAPFLIVCMKLVSCHTPGIKDINGAATFFAEFVHRM